MHTIATTLTYVIKFHRRKTYPYFQSTLRRRTKLRDKWYFLCACPRCSDPTERGSHASSLVCPAAIAESNAVNARVRRCGGTMTAEEGKEMMVWRCGKCPNRVPAKDVLAMENE